MLKLVQKTRAGGLVLGASVVLMATSALADIMHLDDVIVNGSLCAGLDCVNGENFGFDTLRIKENNMRVHFDDTSASASFPANDWRIVINDSANGGANYFAVHDATANTTPFRVDAAAPTNSLYVRSTGDLGLGTSVPAVKLHMVKGNTPTIRLEQDGSSGFTLQTWDIAGNEAGFFVRDVTHASSLPFRVLPGAASQALVVAGDSAVGIGAGTTPNASLHVKRTDGTAKVLVEETNATVAPRTLFALVNNGSANFTFEDTSVAAGNNSGRIWKMKNTAGDFLITTAPGGAGEKEFSLDVDGNLVISGSITTTGGTCGGGCDKVFDAEYELPAIADHAREMWENRYLPNVGPTQENGPINISDKMGRMLNELEYAHIYIEQLNKRIDKLETALLAEKG